VSIRVYVAPRSSANRVLGLHGEAVKISLTAPPVEGAANRALVDFLARLLGVPRSSVAIESGETSRNKIVSVDGIDVDDARRKLGIAPG
jgi:uncharacterized protein (TIGR00251 family)